MTQKRARPGQLARAERVLVRLPADLLTKLDQSAKAHHLSRNMELIRILRELILSVE